MKLPSFLTHEHPIRFAHRGSCILWPENTMAAFQGAVDLGYRYIETDIHVTRDGTIVTFHDHRLDRLTDGSGQIGNWEWKELRKLDAAYNFNPEADYPLRGKGVQIPSLEEVMTTFPNIMLNIDLKQKGIEQILADFIQRHNFSDRVLVASFHDRRTRRFRKITSRAGIKVATSAGLWNAIAFWVLSRFKQVFNIHADALQVPYRMKGVTVVDKKMAEAAHEAGKHIHVWGVNEKEEMHALLELGVDGIITDRPDLLDEVIHSIPNIPNIPNTIVTN